VKLPTDDDLTRVDNVWLGPDPSWTFPWPAARYSAYVLGLCLFIAFAVLERALGIHRSLFSITVTLAAVIAATRWIGAKVTFETGFRALVVIFWGEMTAPRPGRPEMKARIRPAKVKRSWKGVTVRESRF
jgi:hypothetical protein